MTRRTRAPAGAGVSSSSSPRSSPARQRRTQIGWRLTYYKKLGFNVESDVNGIAEIQREALEEVNEEEGEQLTLEDSYVRYDGDLVALCARWQEDDNISVQ